MQLYAKDSNQELIFVDRAERQKNYFCMECGTIVRVRGGIHRQNHFYHLEPHRTCFLHAKSLAHIHVQCHLQTLLSPEECHLEHAFPEIGRIADVVWAPRHLIFEIQCSPISAEEVKKRNEDYASVGFQVVWILHDTRFNQWRLSAAEKFLKEAPHYYTNMDSQGEGMIYDQYSLSHGGIRQAFLEPLPVNLKTPYFLPFYERQDRLEKIDVQPLLDRLHWPVFFSGDFLSKCIWEQPHFYESDYWEQIQMIEARLKVPKRPFSLKNALWGFLRPYKLFLNYMIEKACK
jgi:competence protein CoiA